MFTAFGRCPERPSRLWGSGTDEVIPAEVVNQKATPAKEQIKQIYCLEKIYAPFTELSKAFETATVLVAVVEHLSERQRVMRSNR